MHYSVLFLLLAASPTANGHTSQVGFGNDCSESLDVFWVDGSGNERKVTEVASRKQAWIKSFEGHRFVFRKPSGEKVNETTIFAKSQFTGVQCDHPCHLHYGENQCLESLPGYKNKPTLQSTWNQMNHDRVLTNQLQPQHLRNYTALGFKKMKIPPKVWAELSRYYEDNKDNAVLEDWSPTNPYINHWEVPPMMIWLPELHSGDPIKQDIFDGLQPVLEEWSGTELKQTDMYGMRVYKRGMFLENHVDRVATHVISCIMHIADSDDHKWPLNIYDHYGREHNVTIAAGEMVLYESATCVHGRPSKFQGDYYVNAFAHFRPTNWVPHLRRLHKEGKLTKVSSGPGEIDREWRSEGVTEAVAHDDL